MLKFIQQYFTTVLGALTIMSVAYFMIWVIAGKKLSNRKIQLSKRAGWPQIKDEIVATLFSFIGSTAFMLLLLSFKESGFTKFYAEAGKYGWWYEAVTVVFMLCLSDTWFYWSHRIMHHPSIYKYVHALHHKSLDVNPYTSTSFHVIESIWLTVWIMPLVMWMPVSMTALGIMQVLGTLNNLKSHLGYELFPDSFRKVPPFNMLVTATNHSLHHTQYNGNYGLFFRFWDIVCGTELNQTTTTFKEIHERKNETIIDNTKYRTLTIDKLVKENQHTVSVYFKPTDTAFYQYKAGQYLTLKVSVDGKTHNRCFSLSSSPNIDHFLRITVKLKGEVSHYFYHTAKIGDTVQSLLPVGDFTFVPNTLQNNYVMVAGGSGITPLYSMINQILHVEPKSRVTLLYANANEENIIFKNELNQLAHQYPQFKYIDFISGNKRMSKDDVNNLPNTQYYVCGPDALKEGITGYLKDLKIPSANIHVEHFVDGYMPWLGLLKRQLKKTVSKAAILTLLLGFIIQTAIAQTEIVGTWKDKSHPDKIITIVQSANHFIGKDKKDKIIFNELKFIKTNEYKGILINPDNDDQFNITLILISKNEFTFKVKKFIFSKEFIFSRE